MLEVRHKRGDTVAWNCAYTDESGAPVDLTGYTIRSQVRSRYGAALADLTVENRNDAAGTFELAATAGSTAAWTPGSYECDVELTTPGGSVRSTETFAVRVVADVTR